MAKKSKSKDIKLTKDEIENIKNLRENFNNITVQLGELELSRIQTEQRLEQIQTDKLTLETRYNELATMERNVVNELQSKYGVGSLDLTTGVFKPQK
tara:strand:- start:298 stop:588 length:291 start_codon:yes stop_codon:yes gene_type:complete